MSSFGATSVLVLGVASLMNDLSHLVDPYIDLRGKYGTWAVETAIAVCPLNDWDCIERETKRLYQSRISRR